MTSAQQLQHLYWRAGFGPRPQDLAAGLSPRKALRQLLHDSATFEPLTGPALAYADPQGAVPAEPAAPRKTPTPDGTVTTQPDPTTAGDAPGAVTDAGAALRNGGLAAGVPRLRRAALTPEQRKMQNQGMREAFINMSTAWMARMAASPAQLREKMTLFWHGHFACRVRQPNAALRLHDTTRRHALGKFPDLLLAVSRESAMLQFLNNQQNRKARPNENFAREVMELFTLGRGNYSETDVKEAARAFTGWGYDGQGNFISRERDHDAGASSEAGSLISRAASVSS